MILKIAIATFGFIFAILMFALASWFETEELQVQSINRQHLQEIRKLRKISKINSWLDKVVKPSLSKTPTDANASDGPIVNFFDEYAYEFDFEVDKYIYDDENTHNLNIKFSISRDQQETLENLMKLKYQKGFLQFNNFEVKDKLIKGELKIVQPFYGEGESNASNY